VSGTSVGQQCLTLKIGVDNVLAVCYEPWNR